MEIESLATWNMPFSLRPMSWNDRRRGEERIRANTLHQRLCEPVTHEIWETAALPTIYSTAGEKQKAGESNHIMYTFIFFSTHYAGIAPSFQKMHVTEITWDRPAGIHVLFATVSNGSTGRGVWLTEPRWSSGRALIVALCCRSVTVQTHLCGSPTFYSIG